MIRVAGRVVAVVMLLAGGTFLLQGIGILPGSFMTGDQFWAGVGAVLLGLGVLALWLLRRPATAA